MKNTTQQSKENLYKISRVFSIIRLLLTMLSISGLLFIAGTYRNQIQNLPSVLLFFAFVFILPLWSILDVLLANKNWTQKGLSDLYGEEINLIMNMAIIVWVQKYIFSGMDIRNNVAVFVVTWFAIVEKLIFIVFLISAIIVTIDKGQNASTFDKVLFMILVGTFFPFPKNQFTSKLVLVILIFLTTLVLHFFIPGYL